MPFVDRKWVDGPKEKVVRDGLPSRPANIIEAASRGAHSCFAGFFNGCLSKGCLRDGSLSIGKAECEWDWEKTWGELRTLGLITWTTEQVPNHPTIGGYSTYIHLTITDLGYQVRKDSIAWFNALMEARDQDEERVA